MLKPIPKNKTMAMYEMTVIDMSSKDGEPTVYAPITNIYEAQIVDPELKHKRKMLASFLSCEVIGLGGQSWFITFLLD